MARSDIAEILARPDILASEMESFVPNEPKALQFRADLAGLLVVAICASYETAVKETLITFATNHHAQFGIFAQNHFNKLNSRIGISDLHKYTRTFDDTVHGRFGKLLDKRKKSILGRVGYDIVKSYEQILSWRHDFAHAGIRNTTIEEALITHTLAKRVLFSFNEAFD